jgi:hypothetical protein
MDSLDLMQELTGAANNSLAVFIFRFLINFAVATIVIRYIYYPIYRNKDFVFTFFLFNLVNFLICFLLSSAVLKIGFAFGLFAIFTMLRFQTVRIPVREMAYLFISVTLGIINALASIEIGLPELLFANLIILACTYFLEYKSKLSHENFKQVTYEKIELIKPSRKEELLEDLRQRTGLPIQRVEIISIDFLRDTAYLNVFYQSADNEASSRGLGWGD